MSIQSVSEINTGIYPVNTQNRIPHTTFKVDMSQPADRFELFDNPQQEKKPSTMKKIGTGFASVMLPGLGQFINGDTKKGIGFLAANFALIPLSGVLGPIAPIANIALQVASGIDAIRNVK